MSLEEQKNKSISFYLAFPLIKLWQSTRSIRKALNFAECRFHPSCSDYCLEAISVHGLLTGLVLGIKRICRCNPLFEGGVDLVKPKEGVIT